MPSTERRLSSPIREGLPPYDELRKRLIPDLPALDWLYAGAIVLEYDTIMR